MLFKPEYDENGKKILCEMNGINSEMLMDIYVKKMKCLKYARIKTNVQFCSFQATLPLKREMK